MVRKLAAARLAHLSSHHKDTYVREKWVVTDLINHSQVEASLEANDMS